MKKKFKIMYTSDHTDIEKRGQPYLPPAGCFVVMNGGGVFFQIDSRSFYPSITKLSEILGKYDVVWKGE